MLPHSHDVLAVAFRPDGRQVACSTLDGQIHLWDPLEGELVVGSPPPPSFRPPKPRDL